MDKLPVLDCVIAYNEYGGYCIPKSSAHRPAAQKVLAGEVHEPETIKFIRENCGDGGVVHAGAYFGDFLPALADCAAVLAFEPNMENYRCACITVHISALSNAIIYNHGLARRTGGAILQIQDEYGESLGGGSRVIEPIDASGGVEKVKMMTLDRMIPDNADVSLIHLDVEGYEYNALRGAIKTIKRCFPIIIVEGDPELDFLLDLKYVKTRQMEGNTVYAP